MNDNTDNKISMGGAAFPRSDSSYRNVHYKAQQGMTLRDYFAAAALTGLLAHPEVYSPESVALMAWNYADVMIAARMKGDTNASDN